MVEPFMHSFSAKVYEQMRLLNDKGEKIFGDRDEALLAWIKSHPERIADLIPPTIAELLDVIIPTSKT
jgi:hypothetical protein